MSVDKAWKERGVGDLKINIRNGHSSNDNKTTARFLLRADGSHRVVLNSPINKLIKVQDPTGGPPKGRTACFAAFDMEGKLTLMQVKVCYSVSKFVP